MSANVITAETLASMTSKERKDYLASLKSAIQTTKDVMDTTKKVKKDEAQKARENLLNLILDLPNVICTVKVGERHFDLTLNEALDGSVKGKIPDAKSGEKLVQIVMQGNRVDALTENMTKLHKMFKGEAIRTRKNKDGVEVPVLDGDTDNGDSTPENENTASEVNGTLDETHTANDAAPEVAPEAAPVEAPEQVQVEASDKKSKKGSKKGKK